MAGIEVWPQSPHPPLNPAHLPLKPPHLPVNPTLPLHPLPLQPLPLHPPPLHPLPQNPLIPLNPPLPLQPLPLHPLPLNPLIPLKPPLPLHAAPPPLPPSVAAFNDEIGLLPQSGRDMWHSHFVKSPSSPSSVTIKTGMIKSQTSRWDVISKQLGALAKKTAVSVEDVKDAVFKYNPKYKGQWSFEALSLFVKVIPKEENYFSKLFPKIAALALKLPDLVQKWSPRKKEKLRAIMYYFQVVTDESELTLNLLFLPFVRTVETQPKGLVTFERRCLKDHGPNWRSSIGGGVLGSGLVQEEILFLMNPELIVSRLFTERLADNECLIVTGCQQFSCYSGYGDTFEWAGPHEDRLHRDEWGRLRRQILAIDAVNYKHRRDQYNMIRVTRELNKAYCGFKADGHNEPDIATGKWGSVVQLMAAAKAKRGLAFFTFEDETLKQRLQQTHRLLVTRGTTVDGPGPVDDGADAGLDVVVVTLVLVLFLTPHQVSVWIALRLRFHQKPPPKHLRFHSGVTCSTRTTATAASMLRFLRSRNTILFTSSGLAAAGPSSGIRRRKLPEGLQDLSAEDVEVVCRSRAVDNDPVAVVQLTHCKVLGQFLTN
ncbi:hypothetical protein FQN60_000037 [Etheostoma spectabile]|uniref:PARG catalytic Macro domain-containing protein n=1 Tax=Etheostoma spectabile TaxID=54343 RepID=A0A5J5CDH6_9PERO|nr:hypothetical protein FQN60_000037 [Etheostoma spectabile]